jgi:hypothetical protein
MPRATRDVSVCVAPASQPGAVTLTTRAIGQEVLEQTIVADGAAHPITETGCTGTQRAAWSSDGRRVFTRGDLACAGQPARAVTGLSLITPDGTWLDVQGIDVAGTTSVRVRRYAPANRPRSGSPALSVDAVKEALGKVAVPVVEAALIETNSRFPLDNRTLIELADSRVPGSVIDLMVALSNPDKFRIERRAGSSLDLYPAMVDAEWSGLWGFGYPYMPWYPGYYGGSYYRYYYSPFAYGLYDLYGPYSSYFYPSGYIVNTGGGVGGGDVAAPVRSGQGRVIDGVGYTLIRPRQAEPSEGSSGGSSRGRGTMTPSGATQSSGGVSAGSSSGGGGGSGSGSGGSDGGGRTAQPR